MKKIELAFYVTESGKSPYVKWVDSLTTAARVIVYKRIARLETGNFGDAKAIKGSKGLYELRIHEGPGYRIYFGKIRNQVVSRKNPSSLLTHLLALFAPQKPPLVTLTMLSVFEKQIALKIWITFDEGFLRLTTSHCFVMWWQKRDSISRYFKSRKILERLQEK